MRFPVLASCLVLALALALALTACGGGSRMGGAQVAGEKAALSLAKTSPNHPIIGGGKGQDTAEVLYPGQNHEPGTPVNPGGAATFLVSTQAAPGVSIIPTMLQVQGGATGQFTIIQQSGFQNLQVSGCNGAFSGATYTITPTANCTVIAVATPVSSPGIPGTYLIETVAGNGSPNLGDGGLAIQGTLVSPDRVLASSSGVVYISDTLNNRIASVDAGGTIRTFAGRVSAEHQPLGDDGPATDAVIRFPRGLYETADGLYIGDQSYTVRLVDGDGVITKAAISDRSLSILSWGLAVDSAGRIYIADISHHRILRVEQDGSLTVIAGTGVAGTSGDNGPGGQAQLRSPREVRFDGQGNLLIGSATAPLRQVNLTTGVITTRLPNVMAYFDIDSMGYFVATRGNQVIRIHPTSGSETIIAGTGAAGFSGDGGPATSALFNHVTGVSIDTSGNIIVADSGNHRVRKITPLGVVTTLAGGGPVPRLLTGVPDSQGIAFDSAARMFITDFQYNFLRRVLPGGATTVIAGSGVTTGASDGDGGPAADATFGAPSVTVFDGLGRLFFLDLTNSPGTIRMIEPGADGVITGAADETITRIAGQAVDRTLADHGAADGGPARNAVFNAVRDFVMDSHGNLILPDWFDNRVRKVTPGADGVFNGGADEIITTIAGNGSAGQLGDGGLAINASIEAPTRIAIDADDNLYIHVGNNTPHTAIRRIDANTGVITTVTYGLVAYDMLINHAGELFYVEGGQVMRVNIATGTRIVIAGTGARGFSGDGGDALLATFRGLGYLAVDANDDIYVVDNGNFRIRRLVKQ